MVSVDHQPGLSFRMKNIACMQVGRQQDLSGRIGRQLFEQPEALANKPRIRPTVREPARDPQ